MEWVEAVGHTWTVGAAGEMSMDCEALLIDVHINIEQTFIPTIFISKGDESPQLWRKEIGGFPFS